LQVVVPGSFPLKNRKTAEKIGNINS
jgi:hypothetical protein